MILQEATHCVRAAFGDSSTTYGGPSWAKPLHGIGQGNDSGPPIWAVISSTLLDNLETKGYGLHMLSPISSEKVSFVGYSFVHDSDLVQSAGEPPNSTVQKLQQALDTWEGGLKITGGALGPEKSYWYLEDITWSRRKWFYAPVEKTPATLLINDINNVKKTVRCIPLHNAKETLGVWIAPNGNTKTQCKKCWKNP
jgi:hypothetical protein